MKTVYYPRLRGKTEEASVWNVLPYYRRRDADRRLGGCRDPSTCMTELTPNGNKDEGKTVYEGRDKRVFGDKAAERRKKRWQLCSLNKVLKAHCSNRSLHYIR